MNELTLYQTASAIRKQLPSIDLQYDYQQKLSALKQYAKNKEFYVAQLEAEVALAMTLPQAMKQGDVKAERNGKGHSRYVLLPGNNTLNPKTVSGWRQLSGIPAKERAQYYATEERPTRNGLFRWWENQTVDSESIASSHGIITDLRELDGETFGCIYADPPWAYSNKATRAAVGGNSKDMR